jgi:hypothetical protein
MCRWIAYSGGPVYLEELLFKPKHSLSPAGSVGEAAIYTEHVHHVAMLRKILLRMRSWQNYIYIEGH